VLTTYTIYDHPLDIPTGWVVREWKIGPGGPPEVGELLIVAGSLEAARDAIPPGLFCLPRSPEDDPNVVETWL
jgi:hypothetical protein